MNKFIIFLCILSILIIFKIFVFRIIPFIDQYIFTQELDIHKRYNDNNNSWVVITGTSSGMGEQFAYQFAERGFNLLLLGSKRTKKVISKIKKKSNVNVRFIEIDFSKSFEKDFFDPIQKEIDSLGQNFRILINNVGYRTASIDYLTMPLDEMKKTISVGTLVQSKLMQIALQKFSQIKDHTAIVNITAQGSLYTDLFAISNDITVPHLACYEASNAYGYYHAKSVYEEIKNKYPQIDFLIITPGAVVTSKTDKVLHGTLFSIDCETFVKNILKLLGNKNGIYCAHWGHSFSSGLLNIFPFIDQKSITKTIGIGFASQTQCIS